MNLNVVIRPGETVTIDLSQGRPQDVTSSSGRSREPNPGAAAPSRGPITKPR
jgi:hypothetical protein